MGTTLINIIGGAISLKYTQTHVTSVITSPGRDLPQILASDWSCPPAHIPSNAGFWLLVQRLAHCSDFLDLCMIQIASNDGGHA